MPQSETKQLPRSKLLRLRGQELRSPRAAPESDFLVNIPLTEDEILILKEQAKEVYAHFIANKHLLLSKKWEYNVSTPEEGESNVPES